MTLILPRTDLAKDFITGGQDNIGIRVPSHTVAFALLKEFEDQGGLGVAAPSANRFGAVSPTTASAVNSELGKFLSKEDQILDGGDCEVGIESTIIDCRTLAPSILRPGAITNDMINQVINYLPKNENLNLIRTSGSFKTHYAPKAEVVLDQVPNPGDGLIALSMFVTPNQVIRLASPQNTKEFAKVLYQSLRDGDQKQIQRICIYLPIGDDIAVAIRDRLEKASSKNSL
jgi:L-threonylcarbamoyladenylate synthase